MSDSSVTANNAEDRRCLGRVYDESFAGADLPPVPWVLSLPREWRDCIYPWRPSVAGTPFTEDEAWLQYQTLRSRDALRDRTPLCLQPIQWYDSVEPAPPVVPSPALEPGTEAAVKPPAQRKKITLADYKARSRPEVEPLTPVAAIVQNHDEGQEPSKDAIAPDASLEAGSDTAQAGQGAVGEDDFEPSPNPQAERAPVSIEAASKDVDVGEGAIMSARPSMKRQHVGDAGLSRRVKGHGDCKPEKKQRLSSAGLGRKAEDLSPSSKAAPGKSDVLQPASQPGEARTVKLAKSVSTSAKAVKLQMVNTGSHTWLAPGTRAQPYMPLLLGPMPTCELKIELPWSC